MDGLDGYKLDPVQRLQRDIRTSAAVLGPREARYLVDTYYAMQEDRIADDNQVRALVNSAEPHAVLAWLANQHSTLEKQIAGALKVYAEAHPVGRWAMSICGIGPIISAGLLAHIDIQRCPTVGHIWRFAGLDPTTRWEKGQKRPHNAKLKVVCWKAGESFVKVKHRPDDVYGKVYAERKALEEERNAAGLYADQAAAVLAAKRIGKDTEARKHYEAGRLPPAHIHARAKRYAVKLFLSHWHHVAWEAATGSPPPKPYVLAHLRHAHYIAPPNWPMRD